MVCRRCEARALRGPRRRERGAASPGRIWGIERIGSLLCARCGAILAGEDIAQRLLDKESQLAQFGLASAALPLLGLAPRKEDV